MAFQAWTPDGRAVLARVSTVAGAVPAGLESPAELWRVPLDGGEPRKLELNLSGMTHFSVHPDGRQVAYGVIERAKDDEVWVLENFLKK